MKKILALFLTVSLLFSLTGCSELTGLDAQTLMSPPRTTADRQAVYALLQGDAAGITLVYPRNGDHRSAIISHDLTGDGAVEAVGFYVPEETVGITVEILMKDAEGEWQSLGEFTSAANQVDKVFFGDLTGDGIEEIVVGWGDPQTATASVSVYRIKDGEAEALLTNTVPYSELLLTDFDGDGIRELFVMDVAVQTAAGEENVVSTPLGSLYRFDGDHPFIAGTVPLDTTVTRYSTASFVQIASQKQAAVIDGLKADGRMITQVVLYNEQSGMLSAPLSNLPAENPNPTDRATAVAVTARDVNGDGFIELPTAQLMYSTEGVTPDSTNYIVTWCAYRTSGDTLKGVARSVLNTAENYLVLLPDDGENYVCVNDPVTRTASFYTYGSTDAVSDEKFSITVYSDEGWQAKEQALAENESLITSMAGRVYMLAVLDKTLQADEAGTASLRSSFAILNE